MPKDAELGRALAVAISAADTGRIKGARFSYDPFLEMDELPEGVQVFIMPSEYVRERVARSQWSHGCTLALMLMVAQAPNEEWSEERIDRWLDDFDAMLEIVQNVTIGNQLPVSIEQEQRYEREELTSNKRLICVCGIIYKVI